MAIPSLPVLALFAVLVLTVALYGLTLAGHFPAEHRGETLRSHQGTLIIAATAITTTLAGAMALNVAINALPWPAAVIAAGAALLVAPLVLQKFPDSVVNGRRGLLGFAILAAALAALALNSF